MPAAKTAPELLMPAHRHLVCSARLAAVISDAWLQYKDQKIDPGTLLVTVPEGGQRSHDVYRATVQFRSDGMIVVIDSWSTCSQMCRAGKVYVDCDYNGDLEMSHTPPAPASAVAVDDHDQDLVPWTSKICKTK